VKETVVYVVAITTRDTVIGEWLKCKREPGNKSGRYTVVVKRDGIIFGHLPRKISQIFRITLAILTLHNGNHVTTVSLTDFHM